MSSSSSTKLSNASPVCPSCKKDGSIDEEKPCNKIIPSGFFVCPVPSCKAVFLTLAQAERHFKVCSRGIFLHFLINPCTFDCHTHDPFICNPSSLDPTTFDPIHRKLNMKCAFNLTSSFPKSVCVHKILGVSTNSGLYILIAENVGENWHFLWCTPTRNPKFRIHYQLRSAINNMQYKSFVVPLDKADICIHEGLCFAMSNSVVQWNMRKNQCVSLETNFSLYK